MNNDTEKTVAVQPYQRPYRGRGQDPPLRPYRRQPDAGGPQPYQMGGRRRALAPTKVKSTIDVVYDMCVVAIFLRFLQFPAGLADVMMPAMGTLYDYGCFALQWGLMLITSGNNYMEVTLLSMKKKYWPIYFFGLYTVGLSAMITPELKSDIITYTRFLTTINFAIWVTERYSPEEILDKWYLAQIAVILATMFFIVRYRGKAYQMHGPDGTVLRGLPGNKNDCAAEFSFGIMTQLTFLRLKMDRRERPSLVFLVVFMAQMALMLQTKAVGGLLCAFVPTAYFFFVERNAEGKRRLPLGFLFVGGSVGFLIFAMTIIPLFEPLFNAMGKDATLTGRIPLWNQVIYVIMNNNTMTGWGYPIFWKVKSAYSLVQAGFEKDSFFAQMTAGSHNLTLEMVLYIGLPGLAVFFMMIIESMRTVPWMKENQYVLCASSMISFMLFGLTERGMAPDNFQTLYLFIALATACSVEGTKHEKLRTKRRIRNGNGNGNQ